MDFASTVPLNKQQSSTSTKVSNVTYINCHNAWFLSPFKLAQYYDEYNVFDTNGIFQITRAEGILRRHSRKMDSNLFSRIWDLRTRTIHDDVESQQIARLSFCAMYHMISVVMSSATTATTMGRNDPHYIDRNSNHNDNNNNHAVHHTDNDDNQAPLILLSASTAAITIPDALPECLTVSVLQAIAKQTPQINPNTNRNRSRKQHQNQTNPSNCNILLLYYEDIVYQNEKSDWFLSSSVMKEYEKQFLIADEDHDMIINGREARKFFLACDLSKNTLSQIWVLCDVQQNGTLNEMGFYAMHHICQTLIESNNALSTDLCNAKNTNTSETSPAVAIVDELQPLRIPRELPECLTASVLTLLKSSTVSTAKHVARILCHGFIRTHVEKVHAMGIPVTIKELCCAFCVSGKDEEN